VRAHEKWCASRYHSVHGDDPPSACDCGAERENAQTLASFNPLGEKKGKVNWAGNLPAQFCLACEGSSLKRAVVMVVKDGKPQARTFAVCLDCMEVREIAE